MSDQFAAIFRRRPNDGWFRAGRFDVTTTDIICALAVLSMFLWGLARGVWDRLWFAPVLVRDFEIWRLVTWPIATEPAIWPLLGIVFFWLFGQQLEALFGRGKFVTWVIALTVIPALILTALGPLDNSVDFMIQYGLSTLFLGGIWVYAATYPGVKWFEVIPLWALAAVFTVLNLLQFKGVGANGQVIFLLVSVAVALVAGRSLGLATGWPIPHIPLDGSGSSGRSKKKSKQRRPTGSSTSGGVVQGPWKNGSGADAATERCFSSRPDRARLATRQDRRQRHGLAHRRREEASQRPQQAPPQPLTPGADPLPPFSACGER